MFPNISSSPARTHARTHKDPGRRSSSPPPTPSSRLTKLVLRREGVDGSQAVISVLRRVAVRKGALRRTPRLTSRSRSRDARADVSAHLPQVASVGPEALPPRKTRTCGQKAGTPGCARKWKKPSWTRRCERVCLFYARVRLWPPTPTGPRWAASSSSTCRRPERRSSSPGPPGSPGERRYRNRNLRADGEEEHMSRGGHRKPKRKGPQTCRQKARWTGSHHGAD